MATPGESIRKHCLDCVGKSSLIYDCQGDKLVTGPCHFYKYRMGKGRPSVKLIRKYCLCCMGDSWKLVDECKTKVCPFHPYRFGKNPNVKTRHKGQFKSSKHTAETTI